jgi:hypothetical protein
MAKRCCYGNIGATRIWRLLLELVDQLPYLPKIDTSLRLRLGILTPKMDTAIRAVQNDDVDVLAEVFDEVAAEVYSPSRRIELARARSPSATRGVSPPISPPLPSLELGPEESMLFASSVAESLAVLARDRNTPAGILVAAR